MASTWPQTQTFTTQDDFGLIDRGPDDVAVCQQSGSFDRTRLCKLVDDAIVYYRVQGGDVVNALFQQMGNPPARLPGMPPGRIPEFYRILAAMRFSQQLGGRALTLREILFVIEANGDERDRDDDFYRTRTLVKAVMGLPLTEPETTFMKPRLAALQAAHEAAVNNQPPPSAKPSSGAAPIVLAAGGFAVGGPIGAGIGLAVGLLASKK